MPHGRCAVKRTVDAPPYESPSGRGGTGQLRTISPILSRRYSLYTRQRFGVILHHNFDKVGLLGGASDVGFGYGRLSPKPIRVLLKAGPLPASPARP